MKRLDRSGVVTLIDPRTASLASAGDGTIAFTSGRTIGRIARDGTMTSFELPAWIGAPTTRPAVAIDQLIWFVAGRDVVRVAGESERSSH